MEAPARDLTCPTCGAEQVQDVCLACAAKDLERSLIDQEGSPSAPEPPEVPGWTIDRLLSLGGMGEIWLGHRDGQEEALAALKLTSPHLAHQTEVIRRFEMEADLLSSLNHPQIVSILDIGSAADGRLFIAMEYVQGSDLRRLCRAEQLDPDRALDIFFKVSSALAYLHEREVIHRDLKPSNILVSADGTVKLTDFGLARRSGEAEESQRTSLGDGLGTPYYLAPETLRNAAQADERADLYSLGVLLYEMLSGKPPLGTYTPVSATTGLSKQWDALIQKALQDDPDQRFRSVRELRDEVSLLWNKHKHRNRRTRHQKTALALIAAGGVGACLMSLKKPPVPETPNYPLPASATVEKPWENSLGMKFLPLPGDRFPDLLMARTETRLTDYQAFKEEEDSLIPEWRLEDQSLRRANLRRIALLSARGWKVEPQTTISQPGFEQDERSPVCGVSAIDARFFCNWLTIRERAQGRIGPKDYYRLPTLTEWLAAAATSEIGQGNFAREECKGGRWPPYFPVAKGRDEFPHTAPVDSGQPNADGFYHLYGNVFEWVTQDSGDSTSQRAGRIGGSWASVPDQRPDLPRAIKGRFLGRTTENGFRCVLVISGE